MTYFMEIAFPGTKSEIKIILVANKKPFLFSNPVGLFG